MKLIHDVSTDPADPPQFVALRDTRLACVTGLEYSGYDPDEHRRRYPDLVTAVYEHAPAHVFGAAEAFAAAMDWHIAAAIENEGRIEATATTSVFRFKDDIVVRIRGFENKSQLDVRSASRIGKSDLGANARRIREYLTMLNDFLKQ